MTLAVNERDKDSIINLILFCSGKHRKETRDK